MRAVITGATGSIGRALIDALIERGDSVLVLCRKESKRSRTLPTGENIRIIDCPLDAMSELDTSELQGCDVFYHFAWEGTRGSERNDMYLQNRNVKYTLDAVALAKRLGCSCFVGAGSQAEYGRCEGKLSGTTPTFPENGYGMAKLSAGLMSRSVCAELGIRHIWARILSVYGPYDDENTMVIGTVKKLLEGKVPEFTPGEQLWDYLYSVDAAKALIALAEKGKDGRVYCLGKGEARPLREYVELIKKATAPEGETAIGKIPYAKSQVMYLCADIGDLVRDTGYVPDTDFEAGIAETVRLYKERLEKEELL